MMMPLKVSELLNYKKPREYGVRMYISSDTRTSVIVRQNVNYTCCLGSNIHLTPPIQPLPLEIKKTIAFAFLTL